MNHNRLHIQQWPEADLVRRLCHALDIAGLAIEHLAPAGYADSEHPKTSIRPEKPIAETAILLHTASFASHHVDIDTRIQRLAMQLLPFARSAQVRLGLALNPALALDYALAHIVLTRLGYPDDEFDELLVQSRAAQSHASRERLPHRVMEQQWIASLWSKNREGRNRLATARLSILGKPMEVLAATDDDLYAFTHAVMYVTGYELLAECLPRPRVVILAEAEAALARCLDTQDYDLAGELLLTWPLTGRNWSAAAAFAFRVLAEVEDKAGFLPTPATRVKELEAREGIERKRYLLATAYHTAYVMGLLCAASLQPGCAPPFVVRKESAGCAVQLVPWLEEERSAPHWFEIFERLHSSEADALAGMLFTIALQRRAAKKDFAALEQLLRLGCSLGLTDSPVASQAAELLERVALCARGICTSTPPVEPESSKSMVTCAEINSSASACL